jgi:putative DNA primase/helicase
VTDWSRAYIEENDPISAFAVEMCVQGRGNEVPAGQVWKAFDGWCDRNGVEKMTQTGFGLAMSRKYEKKVRNTGTFYLGVRLKNTTDRADEDEE